MDVAISFPDNQEDAKTLDELNAALDKLVISIVDQVEFPGKTAAQIRQLKATKRRNESTQYEQAEMWAGVDHGRECEKIKREQERADLRAVAQWIESTAKPQTTEPNKSEITPVWMEGKGILALIGERSPKLRKILSSPSDYRWLFDLNLCKKNLKRRNGWLYDYYGLLAQLQSSGDFYGDIPPPHQGPPKPDPTNSSKLCVQLAAANGIAQKNR